MGRRDQVVALRPLCSAVVVGLEGLVVVFVPFMPKLSTEAAVLLQGFFRQLEEMAATERQLGRLILAAAGPGEVEAVEHFTCFMPA